MRQYETKPCELCGEQFGPLVDNRGYYLWGDYRKKRFCSRKCSDQIPRTGGGRSTSYVVVKGSVPRHSDDPPCSLISNQEVDRLFFSKPYGGDPKRLTDAAKRAKEICDSCPLIDSCRNFAMNNPEMQGIWGGTTDQERRQLRKRRAA